MSANLPLRDVQLPPAPSWWPPAPGYLMIGGVVLLLLVVAAFFWWQRVDPKGTLPAARRSLLAEGAYRPRVDANDMAALRSWARERYLAMLLERRR